MPLSLLINRINRNVEQVVQTQLVDSLLTSSNCLQTFDIYLLFISVYPNIDVEPQTLCCSHDEKLTLFFAVLKSLNMSTYTQLHILFFAATSLKCYKCDGDNTPPMCNETETCGTGETQCVSQVEEDDGKKSYYRGCGLPAACTAKETACKAQKLIKSIDECSYSCCDEDLCNDKFPALGSGFKVTSGLFVIAVTLSFALFAM